MADNFATAMCNTLLGTLTTSPANTYVQLHTGAPGASGTTAVSSVTTRQAVTWGSASAGSISASNSPAWTSWAGVNGEVDTDLSFWTASTTGTFNMSIPLSSSVTMDTGDSLTLTAITISLPVAS
jgi:hypothetical protein